MEEVLGCSPRQFHWPIEADRVALAVQAWRPVSPAITKNLVMADEKIPPYMVGVNPRTPSIAVDTAEIVVLTSWKNEGMRNLSLYL